MKDNFDENMKKIIHNCVESTSKAVKKTAIDIARLEWRTQKDKGNHSEAFAIWNVINELDRLL